MGIDSKEKARIIADSASDKKADDIIIMDLRGLSGITDFFIVCSGSSNRRVKAIADGIIDKLRDINIKVWHVEGYEESTWALLDYGDVVVHVFEEETRRFYDLERLWGDAPVERIE